MRVIYPNYAAGIRGKLIAQEKSGRWIVKLDRNPFGEGEPLLLSLKTEDFEVIGASDC